MRSVAASSERGIVIPLSRSLIASISLLIYPEVIPLLLAIVALVEPGVEKGRSAMVQDVMREVAQRDACVIDGLLSEK